MTTIDGIEPDPAAAPAAVPVVVALLAPDKAALLTELAGLDLSDKPHLGLLLYMLRTGR